jgi:hypothetical protein
MASNVTKIYPSAPVSYQSRQEVENLLRGEIHGQRPLIAIQNTIQWLMLGHIPNWASPRGLPHDPEATLLGWQPLENKDIPRLKLALESNLKLLNKVLPDLRSLDFSDQTPTPQLSDLELAARVAAIVGHKNANPPPPADPLPRPPIDLVPIVHQARREQAAQAASHVSRAEGSPEPYDWV